MRTRRIRSLALPLFFQFLVFAIPGRPAAADLVVNGGFETGDFTGWTLGGNTDFVLTTEDPSFVHSGLWAAALGEDYSDGTLSQTLATTAGSWYQLSFWLSGDGMTEGSFNEFAVSIGTVTFFDQTNLDLTSYENLTFAFQAASPSTILTFTSRNDLDSFFLDDVSVKLQAVPEPASLSLFLIGIAGALLAIQRRRAVPIRSLELPTRATA